MGSSELSDALNPYFTQPRNPRLSHLNYTDHLQPVIQPSQQYAPHRSELELAISEPLSPPVARQRTLFEGNDAIQELLRVVTQTSQAQENERKRRLAWEQEQEERHAQRQEELERQMMEMQREIYTLRSAFIAGPSGPTLPDQPPISQFTSPVPHHSTTGTHTQFYSPISPMHRASDTFIQSSPPVQQYHSFTPDISGYPPVSPQYGSPLSPAPPSSASPLDSPMIASGNISPIGMSILSPELPSDNISKGSDNECDPDHLNESRFEDPGPSKNHYQRKCRTIQEAMRKHIVRLMGIEDNQNLPDNPEGTTSQPIQLVWDKTTKQSVYNMRTKAFVIEDIKQNRHLYSELPDKDFSKNVLESAYEQTFNNLRQKFRAQRDVKDKKSKGDQRAQNSRRLARRKKKLDNRAAARLKIPIFEHATFDGALQLDCMSSEESDDDADASQPKFVYTRGYLWRSSRLLRFFHALDQEDLAAPKRGSAKMNRAIGTPKDSIGLPPKGVSSWMISRRWIAATQEKQPDLAEALERLVSVSPDLPLETVFQLGEESESDEEEEENTQTQHDLHMTMPQPYSISSLHNALA